MKSATTLVICCLAVTAYAQRPSSRPAQPQKHTHDIEMDALSRATLDRWEAMEYHLGRAGVKTVSFTVKVQSKSPLGDAEATGKYVFNGKKGKLTWDDAGLGTMLATRGWSQETLDRMFVPDSHRAQLKGTRLTAKKKGGTTIVSVDGKTEGGYKEFHYDEDGVGRSFKIQVADPTAGEFDAVIAVKYDKVGGKYVRTGWSFDLDMPRGAFHGEVAIQNKKVGKFHVYGTVVEKQTMAGQPFGNTTLIFSDYKINGAIAEPKKPVATSKPTGKPGAKPTSKPAVKKGPPKV